MSYQEKTGPLMANSHPGSYCGQDAYADMLITENGGGRVDSRERANASSSLTEESRSIEHDARPADCVDSEYRARRLTPIECARLQGFPDDWCADVPHSDSAEYKLWGNGIALPCIIEMMRIAGNIIKEGK